jgi:hypothetical protein
MKTPLVTETKRLSGHGIQTQSHLKQGASKSSSSSHR